MSTHPYQRSAESETAPATREIAGGGLRPIGAGTLATNGATDELQPQQSLLLSLPPSRPPSPESHSCPDHLPVFVLARNASAKQFIISLHCSLNAIVLLNRRRKRQSCLLVSQIPSSIACRRAQVRHERGRGALNAVAQPQAAVRSGGHCRTVLPHMPHALKFLVACFALSMHSVSVAPPNRRILHCTPRWPGLEIRCFPPAPTFRPP